MGADAKPLPPPVWKSPGRPFHHCGVEFQTTLVQPSSAKDGDFEHPVAGWPLVLFFPGLAGTARDVVFEFATQFAAFTPVPFVLASPERETGTWWLIDDGSEWGWISGNFSQALLEKYSEWIRFMAHCPGIDSSRVSLLGYSGGAYAAVELFAAGGCGVHLHGLAVGAVHGHGQSSDISLPRKYANKLGDKFENVLNRLCCHPGADWIEVVHAKGDQWSRIEDAALIIAALKNRQEQLGLPGVTVSYVKEEKMDRKCQSRHFYFGATFLRHSLWAKLLLPNIQPPGLLDGASLDKRTAIADVMTNVMKRLLPLAQTWCSELYGIVKPVAWETIDKSLPLVLQVSWQEGFGVIRMYFKNIILHASSGTKSGLASPVNRWLPCKESFKLELTESEHRHGPIVWRCQSTEVRDTWRLRESSSVSPPSWKTAKLSSVSPPRSRELRHSSVPPPSHRKTVTRQSSVPPSLTTKSVTSASSALPPPPPTKSVTSASAALPPPPPPPTKSVASASSLLAALAARLDGVDEVPLQDANRICPKPGCIYLVNGRVSRTHCCFRCESAHKCGVQWLTANPRTGETWKQKHGPECTKHVCRA